MKKISLIFSILFLGLVNIAKADETSSRYGYDDSFIFIEGGVEFSVYPNGEFDFYYNPAFRRSSVNISVPNVNISFNSGYNYDPYIQYDDYGAVIQIEDVPIYYDYYGRITQAGNIVINYDRYGYVVNVGNLFVQYDPYHRIAGYRGYINAYNRRYVYRPWHRYYRRPRASFSIVYNRPYRAYYQPTRVTYVNHVNYYNTHHHQKTYKNFYRPGQKVRSYNRGSRVAQKREIRSNRNSASRSNVTTRTRNANHANSRRSVDRSTSSSKRDHVIIGARNERSSKNSGVIRNRNSRSSNNTGISNRNAVERHSDARATENNRTQRTSTYRPSAGSRNTTANQKKSAVIERERASRAQNSTRTQRTINTPRPEQSKQIKRTAPGRSQNTSARSSRSNNNVKKSTRSQTSARNVRSRD